MYEPESLWRQFISSLGSLQQCEPKVSPGSGEEQYHLFLYALTWGYLFKCLLY